MGFKIKKPISSFEEFRQNEKQSSNFFIFIEKAFAEKLYEVKKLENSLPVIKRPMYNGENFDEPELYIDITKYGSDTLATLFSYYTQLSDYIASEMSGKRVMLEMWDNIHTFIKAYFNQSISCQTFPSREDRECYVNYQDKIQYIKLNIFKYKAELDLLEVHFNRCLRRIQTISREYSRTSEQWGYSNKNKFRKE